MNICFVTGNKNKLREAEKILGVKLISYDIDVKEYQSLDTEYVAKEKVKICYEMYNNKKKKKTPVFCEDVGLHIGKDFGGAPGANIKFFFKAVGEKNICKLAKNFPVTAVLTIAYTKDGKNVKIFKGETKGKISKKPIGNNGFGWDRIFYYTPMKKTFAQMSEIEKNKVSMRKKALIKFKKFLK